MLTYRGGMNRSGGSRLPQRRGHHGYVYTFATLQAARGQCGESFDGVRGNMKDSPLRRKLVHEITEFKAIFLFLAPFFLAITNYRMYLQGNFSSPYLTYGMSLFNALV